jgi:hypothetical protein
MALIISQFVSKSLSGVLFEGTSNGLLLPDGVNMIGKSSLGLHTGISL